ncbi:MAG: hypothetical protein RLZZ399_926 [Verrucomicrobiota bacterium]
MSCAGANITSWKWPANWLRNLPLEKDVWGDCARLPPKLTTEQKALLGGMFQTHPILRIVYDKMHEIRDLLNQKDQTKFRCRQWSQRFLSILGQLQRSGFEAMQTLAATFQNWREEIARMWRFTQNNGITEGFHRKMNRIHRRAYGFRNFENDSLRVIAACGSKFPPLTHNPIHQNPQKLNQTPLQSSAHHRREKEVEPRGFEPLTSSMPLRRSTN